MSAGVPDLQPDDLVALQAERDSPEPAVKVNVDGPVRTQDLPRKGGGTRTRTVGVVPVKLLAADHRRAIARVISIGQNMLVGLSSASAADPSTMAVWPQNTVFTLTADTELWVASSTGTTSISVVTETWATGE